MNYSTKTIQFGTEFYSERPLHHPQVGVKQNNYQYGVIPTNQHLRQIEDWNDEQRVKNEQIQKFEIQSQNFPKFYASEIKHSNLSLIFALFIIVSLAGGMIAICLSIASNARSWHLLWLTLPLCGFTLFIAYRCFSRFWALRAESRLIVFSKFEKIASASVVKIYRHVRVAHINLNWFAAGIYLVGSLIIIASLIVAWAYNLVQSATQINQFGATQIFATGDWWPLYAIVACGVVTGACLIYQISVLIINHKRAAAIDAYFGHEIVPESEIVLIKKTAQKRDAIIFASVLCLLCLVGVFVYRFVRRIMGRKHS